MRKADRVTQDLMTRIVAGEIEVGSLLPKENELAQSYGVNRSVIREAIKLLEVHRLVRPIRRRGTEVLPPIQSLSADVLRTMVSPVPGRLNRSMLADLLEIRAVIDLEMTRLAAERRSAADLIALEAAVEGLRRELGRPREYSEAAWALTLAVARASGNAIFEMMVHWLRRIAEELGDILLDVRMATPAHVQGIELLVELIRRQDGETVVQLVRAYHEWATPRILEAAERYGGGA